MAQKLPFTCTRGSCRIKQKPHVHENALPWATVFPFGFVVNDHGQRKRWNGMAWVYDGPLRGDEIPVSE